MNVKFFGSPARICAGRFPDISPGEYLFVGSAAQMQMTSVIRDLID